jgi:iron complex outermembrane receptor protein/outer membrane receptor for ferrienterochelin and colicins
MFVYLKDGSSLVFGNNMIYEDRKGGDMQVLENAKDTQHQFFIQNQSLRNTADGVWDRKLSATSNIMTKVSVSFYDRDITTNIFGMKALQTAAYGELSYNQHWNRHNLVAGFNYTGDYLRIHQPDSSNLTDQQYYTFGAFIQDDWTISKHFLIQAGFRGDGYHYSYGKKPYLLPRISVKYSADKHLTVRAGGGLGYKTPNVFSSEVDERDYRLLLNPGEDVKAETSAGVNADINYKTKWRLWELNVNQAFYYTSISHTLLYDSSNGFLRLYNEISTTTTQGAETYIMAKRKNWEYYLGYTYTNAHRNYNNAYPHLPLTAKHKFAALISTEIGSHFRTGIESSFVGNQYLKDGRKTASYMMMALMVRYNIGRFAFVLNGENLLDYRQSKQETVVYPPYENPKFPEIWAPLDGRVINFSVQVKW